MIRLGDIVLARGAPHRVVIVAVTLGWVALAPASLRVGSWPLEALWCCPASAVAGGEVDSNSVVPWADRPEAWRYEK